MTFLTGVLVARWLGPADYGVLSLTRNTFSVVLIVVPLGLDVSLLRYLGEQADLRPARLGHITLLRLIVAAVSTTCVLVALVVGPFLETGVYQYNGFAILLVLTFLALPFAADGMVMTAIFRSLYKPIPQALVSLYVQPLVRLLAILGFLLFGWSLKGVVGGTVVSYAVMFTVFATLLQREMSTLPKVTRQPLREVVTTPAFVKLMSSSVWMAFSLLVYGILRNLDVLLLGMFVPSREVGEYAAMSAVAQVILIFPAALSQTLGPEVARLYGEGRPEALRERMSLYLRQAALLGAPIFSGVAVFGPWLDLLFGSRFEIHAQVALWLAFGYYASATLAPMGFALSMTGRHRIEFVILVCGSLLVLAGCLMTAPRFGGIGVAATVSAGYIAINLARFVVVRRTLNILPGAWSNFIPGLMGLGIMYPIKLAADAMLAHSLPISIIVCILALAVWATCAWIWLLNSAEKSLFTDRIRRLRKARIRQT